MDGGRSHYSIDDDSLPRRGSRSAFAFGASIAAHVGAIALIVLLAPRVERPHSDWVTAYLIEIDNHGAGAAGAHPPRASAPSTAGLRHAERAAAATAAHAHAIERGHADAPPHREPAQRRARDDVHATLRPVSHSESGASPLAAIAPDGVRRGVGAAIGGAGASGRDSGGDGGSSGSAHVEYGQNPPPAYPAQARRRAEQGTVALRILVAADGTVKSIEIVTSSGFDSLDQAAIDAVRTRWRFVPAMRSGVAVESWVEVPIRFALTEASTN